MKYTYTILKGQIVYDDPEARRLYIARQKDGSTGTETLKKDQESKTLDQLGYYWAVLLHAIHDHIIEAGWTKTVKLPDGTTVERPWNQNPRYDSHDWVKSVCANVSEDGEFVTLSEMNIREACLFLENVLAVCAQWGMDMDALEARRNHDH